MNATISQDAPTAVRCADLLAVNSETSQQKQTHNELHLFAGAGGGILGGILLGHTCVCAVEIEPYARQVLLARQRDGILPRFPIWDDIRTFDGRPWRGIVDTVCGGFPCQDISSAGNGKGLAGERSGLWSEMRRVVCEIRPRFVFVENSPMLTIRGLGTVVAELAAMGYSTTWGVFSAADVGARHERERLWLLADANKIRQPKLGKFLRFATQPEIERKKTFGNPSVAPRDTDGVANRVDRLAATGNGQVPAVAALAWRILCDESDDARMTANIRS